MSDIPSNQSVKGVIEMRLTPHDQLYYVGRGGGDTFSTPPFIFHTALYYALGLLPSRFRTTSNSAQYLEDYNESAEAQALYIFPATPLDPTYTTRRFVCMGSRFRDHHEKQNQNLKETGHQRTINPGTEFYTYILVTDAHPQSTEEIAESISPYIRTGKKLTTTRVETRTHTDIQTEDGAFDLGQPVAIQDINRDKYHSFSNMSTKSWLPIDMLLTCKLAGPHITVTPAFEREGMSESVAVSLPTRTSFLGYHQTAQ